MPAIQIVLLVLVGGGLALLAVSNLSQVLPLVFLGIQTIPLPTAAWIGIALAAGAFTSIFLQLLSYLQPGYSPQKIEEPDEVPPRRSTFRREPQKNPEPTSQTSYTPPPPPSETPPNRTTSDWEETSNENWEFETESTAPKSTEQGTDGGQKGDRTASTSRDIPQPEPSNYEVPQEPKTHSQSGSVYSYSYRETDKKQSGVGKSDVVYDANYRVITPPYQKSPEPSEDEEDWGFEDDEDFNDEVESNWRRR